jgi:hypothetical protein
MQVTVVYKYHGEPLAGVLSVVDGQPLDDDIFVR